jgi:hypothetical protein
VSDGITGLFYYDRDGQPITMEEWAEKFEAMEYKVVRQTRVGNMEVSTIWLGLDHGFGFVANQPPLIFETMIFGGDHDSDQWRFYTETEARAHHKMIVRELRKENRRTMTEKTKTMIKVGAAIGAALALVLFAALQAMGMVA